MMGVRIVCEGCSKATELLVNDEPHPINPCPNCGEPKHRIERFGYIIPEMLPEGPERRLLTELRDSLKRNVN